MSQDAESHGLTVRDPGELVVAQRWTPRRVVLAMAIYAAGFVVGSGLVALVEALI